MIVTTASRLQPNLKSINCITLACRHCRNYQPEGRRGGQCQQLGVPVHGSWPACSLMISPFAPTWEVADPLAKIGTIGKVDV